MVVVDHTNGFASTEGIGCTETGGKVDEQTRHFAEHSSLLAWRRCTLGSYHLLVSHMVGKAGRSRNR